MKNHGWAAPDEHRPIERPQNNAAVAASIGAAGTRRIRLRRRKEAVKPSPTANTSRDANLAFDAKGKEKEGSDQAEVAYTISPASTTDADRARTARCGGLEWTD
jgi:hypothetical protein